MASCLFFEAPLSNAPSSTQTKEVSLRGACTRMHNHMSKEAHAHSLSHFIRTLKSLQVHILTYSHNHVVTCSRTRTRSHSHSCPHRDTHFSLTPVTHTCTFTRTCTVTFTRTCTCTCTCTYGQAQRTGSHCKDGLMCSFYSQCKHAAQTRNNKTDHTHCGCQV